MTAEKKVPRRRLAKKKPSERAILGTVRVLNVVDDTGEIIRMKAITPAYALDVREFNDRGLRNGDTVFLDIFKERNPRFWRKFHKLSQFLIGNVDELEGLKAHDALKRVQLECRAHCELVDAVSTADDKHYMIWQPRSLNFDDTDETVAEEVWNQMCDHVARKYFPDWDNAQIEAACEFWERQDT